MQWCFSQVKGAIDDDVAEGKSSDMLKSRCDSEAREMFKAAHVACLLFIQAMPFDVQCVALFKKKTHN